MANFSVSRILSIFVLFAVASCTHNFDAYRLYQLDKGGELLGSQRAAINIFASTTSKSGTLSRSVVLIPHQEVQLDQLETILQERKADGVIILLPPRNTIGSTFLEQWNQLEQDLLGRSFTIPVFFAFEDEVGHIYDDVQTMSVRSNNPVAFWQFPFLENYRLYASIPEPQPIKDVTVTNYKGWLRGAGGDYEKEGGVRPTIAVVAHYDAFGVVPALSSQNVQSAGAAVAVLELARLFSKLYAQQRTQGAYNLLFLLTGGGYHNYAGTKHLLSHLDNQALDSIEFALCLDDIASAKEADWYIHVSRPPKEEKIKSFFGTLNTTSNGNLHLVHKKINISQSDIDWEHEIFSRKKVFAGTLSAKSTPEAGLTKAATFEDKVDTAALIKKIKTIAESIAKHIYGLEGKDLKVFDGTLDVNADFVQSWLNALTQHNRLQSFIQKDKPLLQSLQKTLEDYTEASSETFSLTVESADIESEGELRPTTEYVMYDGLSTTVSAYRVKPVSFDVLFSLVNVAYLSLLYAVIKGPQETIQQVQKLFNDDSKKRKKN